MTNELDKNALEAAVGQFRKSWTNPDSNHKDIVAAAIQTYLANLPESSKANSDESVELNNSIPDPSLGWRDIPKPYCSPSKDDRTRCVDLIPEHGSLHRLEARQNAVCIQYYPDGLDDDCKPIFKSFVWVECKDMDMKDFLTEEAQKLILPTPLKRGDDER